MVVNPHNLFANLKSKLSVMKNLKKNFIQLLRWSEQYTKTDMTYLVRGSFWFSTGQTISSISAFGLAIAFANLVPSETYGAYKYLLSFAAIFSLFTLPGMGTAITRAVARGDITTIYAATRARILWSLLGTFIAFSGSAYYFLNENIELALAFAIIGSSLPVFDTFTLYRAYLVGKRDFKTQTFYHAIAQGISVTLLVVVLLITDNILSILLAYFLPLSITHFVLYTKTTRHFKNGKPDKETLSYGKHLSVLNVLGAVAGNIDKILLWKFLGPIEVAIYTFALAVPEQLKGPLKGVSELAFPKFAAQTPEQIRVNFPTLLRKLFIYAIALFVISLIYVAAAPFIFKIIFPQYMESVIYSQVFMLASVALVGTVPISLISAQRKLKEQYIFSTVQPILQIIAFVALIPPFGIWGAIAARLILRVFFVFFALFLTYRAFRT